MKTSNAIPAPVFECADVLASRLGMSCSEFYSKAIGAYVSLHTYQNVAAKLKEDIDTPPREALLGNCETVLLLLATKVITYIVIRCFRN